MPFILRKKRTGQMETNGAFNGMGNMIVRIKIGVSPKMFRVTSFLKSHLYRGSRNVEPHYHQEKQYLKDNIKN